MKDQSTPATTEKPAPTETATGEPAAEVKATDSKAKPSVLNDKGTEAAPGAPEKYEAFTVPEGFTLDEAVSKEAGELFKGLGMSQEGAQKLVDFYVSKTSEAAEAPMKLWLDTQEEWVNKVKTDPELGPKLPQVKATISKALDSLGDAKLASEFREAMDFTGAGNHPAFIRAFYKLAQRVTEGSHVTGSGPSKLGQTRPGSTPDSAAKALYPNLA